jgi:hypothetical protein
MGNLSFNAGGAITAGTVAGDNAEIVSGTKTTTTTVTLNLSTLSKIATPDEVAQVKEAHDADDKEALADVLVKIIAKYGRTAVKWVLGV